MTKKLMAAAAVALVAVATFSAEAAAQAGSVNATATVAQYSLVTGSGDLAFGTLSRTNDNVIDAAGGAGAATRSLAFNHNVRVTFSNVPTHLAAGSLQLAITLNCAARQGATWGSAAACSGAQLDLDVGSSLTTATLGFGGVITAASAANAVAGSYSGTLDIVVSPRGT
jgi:hypothetical protein